MAEEEKTSSVSTEQALGIERLAQRLNMLDQRLDSIDSMVTAVAERVMSQPITFVVTCPKCGRRIEITLIGNEKPTQ